MDDAQLRSTLEQLHAQLEQTQAVDDDSRQLLQHLMGDIQAVLKESNVTSRASLRQRLDAALVKFENAHSDLALTIKQVLDNLAQV
jgi:hypothetical protein